MVSYWTGYYQSPDSAVQPERTVLGGHFDEAELMAFSTLIHHRRPLPIYFGDCWKCYLCTFECFDFFDMVDHILQTHDPEPFNEEDERESDEGGWSQAGSCSGE
ncbi:MAG: hypothetical protein JW955_12645 [Sedimentisphaerales bacterium]|nr:hypothetical protein [Sedimentisphaerales bacterium]